MRELKNPLIFAILFAFTMVSIIGLIISWGSPNFHLTARSTLRIPVLGFMYFLGKFGVSTQNIKLALDLVIFVILSVASVVLIRKQRPYYKFLGLLLLVFIILFIFFGNKF